MTEIWILVQKDARGIPSVFVFSSKRLADIALKKFHPMGFWFHQPIGVVCDDAIVLGKKDMKEPE